MSNRWSVESSKILCDDQWMTLRADRCLTTEGKIVDPFYVIERPAWISVLALTPDQHVVLVKEYRHGAGVTEPALPSGVVDDRDSDPQAGAMRELIEETGYRPDKVVPLGAYYANWANQTNKVHYFLALDCRKVGAQALDDTEQIEVLHEPLARVLKPGFLQQSFHIANLYLALPYLTTESSKK